MNKFFSFVLRHLVLCVAILIGTVAIVVSGVSFLKSYNDYQKYSKEYEENKKALLANIPQYPEEVIKDNKYIEYDDAACSIISTKSSYKNTYLLNIDDAEINLDEGEPEYVAFGNTSWEVATGFKKGGTITYKINTTSYGMSDIDVYLGMGEVNTTIDNLIDFITIKINGLPVTTVDFDLPKDGSLQQLVLKNTHLITGENILEFATSVADVETQGREETIIRSDFVMPAIPAVTFITNVGLAQQRFYKIVLNIYT